jgi:ssDNA-binding Zn-finger/Zn-ribbon topoisomerase 1
VILKEKIFTNPSDPRLRAGEEAEKQMAFYLQRAFRKRDDCFVINDLRVLCDEDVAQIDHLVVSIYGLFIVESKSVHGTISINQHGDWQRTYNDQVTGMPSPVLQAQEQGRIIKELLRANAEHLLGKILFGKIQKGFGYCPVCIYVAISDNGIIERGMDVPELFKADAVAGAIAKKVDEFASKANLFSPKNLLSTDVVWDMTKDEAKAVAEFLVSEHTLPARPVEANQAIAETEAKPKLRPTSRRQPEKTFVPKVGAICPECGQQKLIRKSISRSDGTETDFLACQGYPSSCKALFPLVAVVRQVEPAGEVIEIPAAKPVSEGMPCPKCNYGKLVKRKAKTEFLGCSNYPKCRFTDYRDQPA